MFLDWDQALDDGPPASLPILVRGVSPEIVSAGHRFRRRAGSALALVGLLGFADDVPLLIGMSIVLLIDICILCFAGTHLICYGCSASYKSTSIAPWHRPWDRREATKHESNTSES